MKVKLEGKNVDFAQDIFDEIDRRIKSYHEINDSYYCSECNSEILQTTVYMSIHLKNFPGCFTDRDNVEFHPFPYCPKCDGKPKMITGCKHIETESLNIF